MFNLQGFGFNGVLTGVVKVASLEEGARLYGGATMVNGEVFSNVPNSDFVNVLSDSNTLSIFVPSTLNVDKQVDNRRYVRSVIDFICDKYGYNSDILISVGTGSWMDDSTGNIVVEDVSIVSLKLDRAITHDDVLHMKMIASWIKGIMKQSSVSMSINNALCFV